MLHLQIKESLSRNLSVAEKMLGEFTLRILVLILGYAYPAFECFKTVEKNKVEIHELRFWCQYWILVAAVTVLERVGDICMSWLPVYGELKLALFIYLWYPKIKGTGYVYHSLLKPYLAKHETDVDQNLHEFQTRAWDLLLYYWENCTQLGQTAIFQTFDYITYQVLKLRHPGLEKAENKQIFQYPTAPSSPTRSGFFRRKKSPSEKTRRPIPPPSSPLHRHR